MNPTRLGPPCASTNRLSNTSAPPYTRGSLASLVCRFQVIKLPASIFRAPAFVYHYILDEFSNRCRCRQTSTTKGHLLPHRKCTWPGGCNGGEIDGLYYSLGWKNLKACIIRGKRHIT